MLDVLRDAWAQVLSVLLGVWLMAAPAVLGYGGLLADAHRVLGPLSAAFALIAVWGHMRPLRWVNVLWGALLVLAPLVVGVETAVHANTVVVGLLLGGLAFVRGRVTERYGGGWSPLWSGDVAGSDEDWLAR